MSEKITQPEIGKTPGEQAINNLIAKQEANFTTQQEADEFQELNEKAQPQDNFSAVDAIARNAQKTGLVPKSAERKSGNAELN